MVHPLVYAARRIPTEGLQLLEAECRVRCHAGSLPPTREQLLQGVQGAEGILSLLSDRMDAEVFDAAGPQLRVVSNFAVGVNNIDLDEARERGIRVGNTPDVLTDATADIAVCLLLSLARRLPTAAADARAGRWKTWEPLGWIGQDLVGKTVGIVGLGRIGAAVAARLHGGWNMQVLYTARSPKPAAAAFAGQAVELEELLERSDFVSLHVPLTDATRHLIGATELERMRRSAVLINTARGEIVDQEALVDALREQRILAAGLDVCTPEPLPTEHPLFQLDNCLLLPHIGSATEQTRRAMAERAARNILAGLAGQPLPYPVG